MLWVHAFTLAHSLITLPGTETRRVYNTARHWTRRVGGISVTMSAFYFLGDRSVAVGMGWVGAGCTDSTDADLCEGSILLLSQQRSNGGWHYKKQKADSPYDLIHGTWTVTQARTHISELSMTNEVAILTDMPHHRNSTWTRHRQALAPAEFSTRHSMEHSTRHSIAQPDGTISGLIP